MSNTDLWVTNKSGLPTVITFYLYPFSDLPHGVKYIVYMEFNLHYQMQSRNDTKTENAKQDQV